MEGKELAYRSLKKGGFLQEDCFSFVGFCLTEEPVAMLLNDKDTKWAILEEGTPREPTA